MRKITTLTATDTIATNNLFEVVDVNDYSMSETGTNKKISASDLANGLSQILTDRVQIVTSTNDDAVLISQSGGGNCLLVYDESTDSSPFVITNTGNVGIGKLIPDAKLDVVGTVKATAFLGPMTGDVTGNASTATTLKTARTIALDGDVVGVATAFDGSKAISIATSIKSESIVNSDISQTAAIAGSKIVPDFVNQNITTTGTLSVKSGSAIVGSSSVAALKITQSGAGDSLLVEDKGNVDNTPFVIDRFGRVVVGHTSVIATKESAASTSTIIPKLQVVGTSASNSAILISRTDPGVNAPRLFFAKSRGNVPGEFNAVIAEDNLGIISFGGADGTRTIEAARILAEADGEIGKDNMPGRLRFFTTDKNSSVPVERMRISSSGNIGIGSIDPQAKLHVDGSIRTKNISATVDSTFAAVRITQTGTGRAFVVQDEMNDASPFVINRDGKVFIGTYSYLNGWNNNQNLTIAGRGNAGISVFGTSSPVFTFNRSGGDAPGGLQAVKKDDALGVINFAGSDGIDRQSTGARIRAQVSGTVSNGVMPSQLEFLTAGSNGTLAERMIISSSGNVGIGASVPDAKLHIEGDAIVGGRIRLGSQYSPNSGRPIAYVDAKRENLSDTLLLDSDDHVQIRRKITTSQDITAHFDANGNVGIGTIDPQAKLHVDGAIRSKNIFAEATNTAAAVRITQTGTGRAFVVQDEMNDASPFVIDRNGRVIVGYTSPLSTREAAIALSTITPKLQVVGNDANSSAILISRSSDSQNSPRLFFAKSRGAVGEYKLSLKDDNLGIISFGGSDGTRTIEAARILAEVDDDAAANKMPGNLRFFTTDKNSSVPTERMRIASTGNVGIGVAVPDAKLHVGGDAIIRGKIRLGNTSDDDAQPIAYIDAKRENLGDTLLLDSDDHVQIRRKITTSQDITAHFDANGNVGIGTTNPSSKLHVDGAIRSKNIFAVVDSGSSAAVRITQTGTGRAFVVQDEMNDASPFIINRDGKVFIGTTTYLNGWNNNQNLTISGRGAAGISIFGTSNPVITLNRSGGDAPGGLQPVQNGEVLGIINFAGSDGIDRQATGARIRAQVSGTVSNGKMPSQLEFLTAGSNGTLAERMIISNSGNVGIGVAVPDAKLHVEGSIKSQNIFAVADSDNVTAVRITQTGNGRALVVQDEMNDASPFIINRAGKVFIGTTGYLNGWNNNQNLIIAGKGNAGINIWGTSNTVLTFNRSGGAEPADSNAVASGDVIGSINFAGSDGINRQTTCARIRARATGTVSDGNVPGQLEFLTRKNADEIERMVIDSDGNVGIGTTNPQAKLHVVGSIKANVATKTTDGLLSSSDKTKLDDMYSNYASSIRVSKLSEKDNCGNRNTFDALVFIDTNSQIRAIGDSTTNTKRFGAFDLWTPSALLPLPNGALASKVYCNHGNLFAIDTQNRAYAMGNNNFGQCAIAGTTADISTFTACSLPASIKKIAIGTDRDVTTYGFLTLDGKVYTSGNNQYGQIGNDTQTNTANAGPVLSLGPGNTFGNPTEEIVDLQMAGSWNGSSHPQTFIALGASGKVYMVGFGGNGQMGNGTSNNVNKKWVTVRDKTAERFDNDLQYLTGITSIYAIGSDSGTTFYALREGQGQLRLNFGSAITKNNMLYGWGYNGQQQLGNLPAVTKRNKAEYLIDNVKKFRGRTTAYGSAFAIRDGVKVISSTTGLPSQYYNEELWVAGDNFRRQLGISVGDNVEWQSVPSLVDLNVEDVYGSSDDYTKNNATHTIVKIVGSNTLYGTGWNAQGQLALGTNDNETTFKKITVPFTSPIKDIECGYRVNAGGYTFILTEDGSLYHAGINRFGWSAMWATNAPKAFFTKINDYILG